MHAWWWSWWWEMEGPDEMYGWTVVTHMMSKMGSFRVYISNYSVLWILAMVKLNTSNTLQSSTSLTLVKFKQDALYVRWVRLQYIDYTLSSIIIDLFVYALHLPHGMAGERGMHGKLDLTPICRLLLINQSINQSFKHHQILNGMVQNIMHAH